MFEIGKRYWIAINPHVYVTIKNDTLLLYNTRNGEFIETDQGVFVDLIRKLHEKENLGVIELSDRFRADPECCRLIKRAIKNGIVSVPEINERTHRPIVFMPVLNLRSDVNRLKKGGLTYIGQNVLKYLNKVTVYLNNSCSQACICCDSYYLQTRFCTADPDIEQHVGCCEIAPETVDNLLLQMKYSSGCRVNILGGDLSQYSNWKSLIPLLSSHDFTYCFWSHHKNADALYPIIQDIPSFKMNILLNYPFSEQDFRRTLARYEHDEHVGFSVLIEDEEQFETIERIVSDYPDRNIEIVPFFNKKNQDFFAKHVFMHREDIVSDLVTQQTIFCNQKLNSNDFGRLVLLPDGTVKANLNQEAIGCIHENSLISMIYQELLTSSSWRNVRSEAPCSACLYQYICPPPSNYEYAIGRANLCTVAN